MVNFSGAIIWTNDLDRMRLFYETTLNLEPHSIRDNFIAYRWNYLRFSIGLHSEVHGSSKEPFRIMLNFNVPDIGEVTKALKQKGVIFLRNPEREHWGGWVCTFLDPDGNTIQLLQQPDD